MIQSITVDLIPNGKMPMLHASQYDDGRQVRINLTENRQAYTLTGNEVLSLAVRKADNTLVTMDIANTYGGKSYVEFSTTEQMTAVSGLNFGELTITNNGTKVGSLNFYLACEPSPEAGGLRSASEINNLNRQIDDHIDEVLPDMVEDIAPAIVEEVAPAVVREVAPAIVEDVAPAILDRLAPSAVAEAAPAVVAELVPLAVAEVAPSVVREVAEPIVEELVPIAVGNNYYNKTETDAKIAGQIDDAQASANKTYSSNKINTLLGGKADVSSVDVAKSASILGSQGKSFFDPALFVNGVIVSATGAVATDAAYRYGIVTKDIQLASRKIENIFVESGYNVGYCVYDSQGARISYANYTSAFDIPQGTYFRITIKPDTHEQGEVANINEVCRYLLFKSEIQQAIDATNANISSISGDIVTINTEIGKTNTNLTGLREGIITNASVPVVAGTQKTFNILVSIKAGQKAKIVLADNNNLLDRNGSAYFSDSSGVISTRWIEPVYFSPTTDISLITLYLYADTITASGDLSLSVELLGLDDAFDEIDYLRDYVNANDYDLPDYYNQSYTDTLGNSHTDYLAWKADRINTLAKSALSQGDAFFFITDQHWLQNAKKSPAVIRYLSLNTKLRKVFNGGDTGDRLQGEPYVKKLENLYSGDVFYAMGNHEFEAATNAELVYGFQMRNEDRKISGSVRNHYYYVDNNYQKIRYVVLCGDGNGYTTAQINWLSNVALDVQEEWKIVIITHWIIFFWGTDTVSYANTKAKDIADLLDAYNANATGGREVIAILQGHTHRDRIFYTDGGLPIIVTACDKYVSSATGVVDEHGDPIYDINVPRVRNTVSEQTFDAVIINLNSRTISLVRVGGHARDGIGNDAGNECEERTVSLRAL